MTKAYFLALLPPVAGFYLWLWLTRKRHRLEVATQAAITLLLVVAVAGSRYAHTFFSTGSLTGEQQAQAAARSGVGLFESVFQVNWLHIADFALVSHIWLGDWSFLVVRSWMYRTLEVVLFSSAVGLLMRRRNTASFVAVPGSLWIYASFLVTFGCAEGYQAISAYRSTGDAGAFGYYAYCIVVAEAIVLLSGVTSLVPGGLRHYVIPAITSLFACLEVFGVCFYQMPYYAGFIAHNSRGTVSALKLAQISNGGFSVLFRNLAWGKPPFIDANTILWLWGLFLVGVIGILCIGILIRTDLAGGRS